MAKPDQSATWQAVAERLSKEEMDTLESIDAELSNLSSIECNHLYHGHSRESMKKRLDDIAALRIKLSKIVSRLAP